MTRWDQLARLDDLPSRLKPRFDVFICSASYEQRCISAADAIAGQVEIGFSIICFTRMSSPLVMQNAQYLRDRLGPRAALTPLSRRDPLKTADMLQRTLSRVCDESKDLNYLVDITTFTHESLLILLKLLQTRLLKRGTVTLVYSPADEYAVGLPIGEKWLSKGIEDIRSVLGYPGNIRASRKSHLIVMVGFENERAEKLLDAYQPHIVSLGFGSEGSATSAEQQEQAFKALANKVSKYDAFEFSCVDIPAAENSVLRQVAKFPDYNIVVAAMNTKLSTVGAASAAFRNSEIQLCYASASQYNIEGYSRPSDKCFIIGLPADFWRTTVAAEVPVKRRRRS